jgi:hypothetical protein
MAGRNQFIGKEQSFSGFDDHFGGLQRYLAILNLFSEAFRNFTAWVFFTFFYDTI